MVIKNQQVPIPTVILRRRTVEARTGLSRSTIYLRMSQGNFPKSIPLGPRAIGWLEAEIEAWLQAQVASVRTDE